MAEAIDLTLDEPETVYVAKPGDEGTRKRVAALADDLKDVRVAEGASRTNLRKRLKALNGVTPAPGSTAQGCGADSASLSKPSQPASVPPVGPLPPAAKQASAVPAPAARASPPTAGAPPAAPGPGPPKATGAQAPGEPASAAAAGPAPSAQQPAMANSLLAQLHAERLARMSENRKAAMRSPSKADRQDDRGAASGGRAVASSSRTLPSTQQRGSGVPPLFDPPRSVHILTYNLWFNEACELEHRMRAVGEAIDREGYPDLLLFQEVTHNMVLIFRQSAWFRRYHCSPVPEDKPYFTLLLARRDTVTLPAMQPWMEKDYDMTCMGRSILYTRVSVGGRPLVVGTTHLESPVGPGAQQMTKERQEQLGVALKELEAAAGPSCDVLLAGDLNWNDDRDGPMRLPPRWCDAWPALHPRQPGFTWDPKANPMLSTARYKGSRLDRVLCRLGGASPAEDGAGPSSGAAAAAGGSNAVGWRLGEMKLIGTTALPGLTHEYRGKRLPVLPSDHFGLLVKLLPSGTQLGMPGTGHVLGGGSTQRPAASSQPAAKAASGAAAAGEALATAAADPAPAKSLGAAAGSSGRPACAEPPRTSLRQRRQQLAVQAQAQNLAAPVDLSAEDQDDDVIVL